MSFRCEKCGHDIGFPAKGAPDCGYCKRDDEIAVLKAECQKYYDSFKEAHDKAMAERDAAVLRVEGAEKERDEWKSQWAEAQNACANHALRADAAVEALKKVKTVCDGLCSDVADEALKK